MLHFLACQALLSLLLFTLHILSVSCWYTNGIEGEESRLTLHHSSPLFTLIFWERNHFRNNVWSSMMTSFRLLLWPAPVFYYDQLLSSMMAGLTAIRWRVVKSGEEWSLTLHLLNMLILSWLTLECEEWRVKAKVAFCAAVFRFRACCRSKGLRHHRNQEWCICARSVPHR